MGEFFRQLFSNAYMPHKMCFLGDSTVTWLQVTSDGLIALSYYMIPILLLRFARQRRDISFKWIFLAFAAFILACGTSHMLGAITVFNPIYRVEGLVKAVTAVASVSTLLLLVPAIPVLVALPSPAVLETANSRLAEEIEERRRAEEAVRGLNEELERRVADRTSDLQKALADLQDEMKHRRSLENQLIQAQKMEAIGRLAGGVAHDFNNLLMVILGYNDMLREYYHDGHPALDNVREIHMAAERASALTHQLLAFSRRQVAVVRVVDLNEAVRHVEKMLRRVIGEDIELVLNLAAHVPPVKIDPSHLDQVLLNLAVNARDAMPDGGTLTIETAAVELDEEYTSAHPGVTTGSYVMIAVGDTGTGMDDATKSRIFEPFFTTKEQGKGTGLGLSIVYGVVKQSGGEILVYSEIAHGTVFKILLPVTSAVAEIKAPEAGPVVKLSGSETILLVEDDNQVRNLARAMLEQRGYRVLACASPEDALHTLREHSDQVALLVTDIVMPGMRGTELASLARAGNPQIRVLFMSGYTESVVLHQGMITPDTPFLRKPFTGSELERQVRAALYGDIRSAES